MPWVRRSVSEGDGRRPQTRVPPHRRLPIGAEPTARGTTHFRVWAPDYETVEVVLVRDDRMLDQATPGASSTLEAEPDGYFSGWAAAGPGARYAFRLDEDDRLLPDPASRFQPAGPHGPSEVVDPSLYAWHDHDWPGPDRDDQVLYEMHIGTFSDEGTWLGAIPHLAALAELGVTTLQVMPVAEFAGRFGWGYDGVDLFAPTHLYGRPDDMRRFADAAHQLGLGVILDVVYNHLGPDGNHLGRFAPHAYTRPGGEWGDIIDYDGPSSGPVREFVLANARYWVEEFHMDGYRLDATQQIIDRSKQHVIKEIVKAARAAARPRPSLIVAENEPQETRYLRPQEEGGFGMDGLLNDDFHHAARVALTGRNEGYFSQYNGTPNELLAAVKHGYLYQGQWYGWQDQTRGTPTLDGIDRRRFVHYLENHDQVANSQRGDRLHRLVHPGCYRALTALLLLAPPTPLLFQGQEFGSTAPFTYFADHRDGLAQDVKAGRHDFLDQFPSLRALAPDTPLPDPGDPRTFERCRLRRPTLVNDPVFLMHRDLLALRRRDPVFAGRSGQFFDGAVFGDGLALRWRSVADGDRLLVLNLGPDRDPTPLSEPLLAPPAGERWRRIWSSEDPQYGGSGTPPSDYHKDWRLAAHSTVVLAAGGRP